MDTLKVGEAIKEAHKKVGLTREELADKVGASVQAVSKWESGKSIPDYDN